MINHSQSYPDKEIFYSKSKLIAYKNWLKDASYLAENLWIVFNNNPDLLDQKTRQQLVDSVEYIAIAQNAATKAEAYQQEISFSNTKYRKYRNPKTNIIYFHFTFTRNDDNSKDSVMLKLKQAKNGDFSHGKSLQKIPNRQQLKLIESGEFDYAVIDSQHEYLHIYPVNGPSRKYRLYERSGRVDLQYCI